MSRFQQKSQSSYPEPEDFKLNAKRQSTADSSNMAEMLGLPD